MGMEDDYIMRMIRDFVRFLAKILLNKDVPMYEFPEENLYTTTGMLYQKMKRMAKEGQINEAENLLYENLQDDDSEQLEMAICFYMYLNEFDDEFLEEHNYSREEIMEGVKALGKRHGVSGVEL